MKLTLFNTELIILSEQDFRVWNDSGMKIIQAEYIGVDNHHFVFLCEAEKRKAEQV